MSLKRGEFGHDLPPLARYVERIAGGVALYDVSPLVPKGRRRAKPRSGVPIDRFFVHHSGRLGKSGFAGAWHSVDFMTRPKWKGGRDFPISGYHLWYSYEPIVDEEGRLALLQLAPFDARAWHTGGMANDRGIGGCLQGNTSKRPISAFQEELLEASIPWAAQKWPDIEIPGSLSWHSDAEAHGGRPKKACPGRSAEAWLRGYRRGLVTPTP